MVDSGGGGNEETSQDAADLGEGGADQPGRGQWARS